MKPIWHMIRINKLIFSWIWNIVSDEIRCNVQLGVLPCDVYFFPSSTTGPIQVVYIQASSNGDFA